MKVSYFPNWSILLFLIFVVGTVLIGCDSGVVGSDEDDSPPDATTPDDYQGISVEKINLNQLLTPSLKSSDAQVKDIEGIPINRPGDDDSRTGKAYAHLYELELDEGQGITITMRSDSTLGDPVDPYLYLLNRDGELVAEDDDSGASEPEEDEEDLPDQFDAQISKDLSTGKYIIVAASRDDGDIGTYTLLVN